MAADYPGACAAIKAKFLAGWTGTPDNAVGFVNEADPVMQNDNGGATPWVLFEIVSAPSYRVSNKIKVFPGFIKAHIWVPSGTGIENARALAQSACDIFDNQLFYNGVTDGCYVRSGYTTNGPPRIDADEADNEDGMWFAITATIPFEYWHQS